MNFNLEAARHILSVFVTAIDGGQVRIENVNLDNETNVKRLEIVYTENKEAN